MVRNCWLDIAAFLSFCEYKILMNNDLTNI